MRIIVATFLYNRFRGISRRKPKKTYEIFPINIKSNIISCPYDLCTKLQDKEQWKAFTKNEISFECKEEEFFLVLEREKGSEWIRVDGKPWRRYFSNYNYDELGQAVLEQDLTDDMYIKNVCRTWYYWYIKDNNDRWDK